MRHWWANIYQPSPFALPFLGANSHTAHGAITSVFRFLWSPVPHKHSHTVGRNTRIRARTKSRSAIKFEARKLPSIATGSNRPVRFIVAVQHAQKRCNERVFYRLHDKIRHHTRLRRCVVTVSCIPRSGEGRAR